jgi:CRISPR-associated exonuclease Cas4
MTPWNPPMYAEAELLPLSGLQHLAYCERQWALIHLEQVWRENRLTVEGRHLHERADRATSQSRKDVRIVTGLMLQSRRLGLVGRADVVEFHLVAEGDSAFCTSTGARLARHRGEWRVFPVEYKRGRSKRGKCDRVQLCAQALCLEEMVSTVIDRGALFYGKTRRRLDVVFDEALRRETELLATRMHELYRKGVTPRVAYESRRCDRCSLLPICIPGVSGATLDVNRYLATALMFAEEEP